MKTNQAILLAVALIASIVCVSGAHAQFVPGMHRHPYFRHGFNRTFAPMPVGALREKLLDRHPTWRKRGTDMAFEARSALAKMFGGTIDKGARGSGSGPRTADPPSTFWNAYHDSDDVDEYISLLREAGWDDTVTTYTLGSSASEDESVYAVRVAHNPNAFVAGIPSVLLIGNVHGNEAVGREILLRAALEYAWAHYDIGNLPWDTDRAGTYAALVDRLDLWFVPAANPDGFEAGTRSNDNGVDIDADFPSAVLDAIGIEPRDYDPDGPGVGSHRHMQPETYLIKHLIDTVQFALVIDMRGGALVTSYPWNGNSVFSSGVYTPTTDDVLLTALARTYATAHATMSDSKIFPGGIVNGANWYCAYRTLPDYAYAFAGAPAISPWLGANKMPAPAALATIWADNRDAISAVLSFAAYNGVRFSFVSHNRTTHNVTTGYLLVQPDDLGRRDVHAPQTGRAKAPKARACGMPGPTALKMRATTTWTSCR